MIPTMDPRTAARILDLADEQSRSRDSRSRAFAGFALILALAAHGAATSGSPRSAQAAAMSPAGARLASKAQAGESPEMKQLMAIGVAAAVSAGASAQDAVQWRVEDGGNGHWYARSTEFLSFPAAAEAVVARGGHLATPVTPQENAFLTAQGFPYSANGEIYGHWIGGIRSHSAGAWTWITGESWSFSSFEGPEPNGCCGSDVRFLVFLSQPGHEGRWDDTSTNGNWDATPMPALIEWSADCNNDGVVDYGQILSGQLADADSNGVPDTCECPCDVFRDGAVNGIDLAAVLGQWGPVNQFTVTDFNRDGVVDGLDLGQLLGAWGPCQD